MGSHKGELETLMKVLFICPEDFTTTVGGSSNRMRQTYSILNDFNFDVTVLPLPQHLKKIPKKKLALPALEIPKGYDLVFINYPFIKELFFDDGRQRIFVDLHDDFIDRDQRTNANWFSRSEDELKTTLAGDNVTAVHISVEEFNSYKNRNICKTHLFLPYMSADLGGPARSPHNLQSRKFDFGFIGGQNFINATAVQNIDTLLNFRDPKQSLLICGEITHGLGNIPSNYEVTRNLETFEFYNSIDTLLLPIFMQTGASTKLIESISIGCPTLFSQQLLNKLGVEPCVEYPRSLNEFREWMDYQTATELLVLQSDLWSQYCSLYGQKVHEFGLALQNM